MTNKNLEIERLRAFAVLLVVLFHSPFKQLLSPYLYSSFTGVDLFFVISGFVVARSFLRSLPQNIEPNVTLRFAHNKHHIVAFYLRRLFRIAPSALFYAALFLLASVLLKELGSVSEFAHPGDVFREIIAICGGFYNYALASGAVTENLAHYWSLSVEEHFYLIAPLLLVLCATNTQRVAVVITAIFTVLVVLRPLTLLTGAAPADGLFYLSHARFDSLFDGVLLAVLFGQYKNLGFLDFKGLDHEDRIIKKSLIAQALLSDTVRRILKTTVGLSLCAILALLPGVTNTAIFGGGGNFHTSSAGFLAYALISIVLVMLASLERGWIFEIPGLKRVLEYIGSRSYAIYLSHWLLIKIYNDLFFMFYEKIPPILKLTGIGYVIQFAVYLGIVMLVSECSYRLIESPFINLGRNLIGSAKKELA